MFVSGILRTALFIKRANTPAESFPLHEIPLMNGQHFIVSVYARNEGSIARVAVGFNVYLEDFV